MHRTSLLKRLLHRTIKVWFLPFVTVLSCYAPSLQASQKQVAIGEVAVFPIEETVTAIEFADKPQLIFGSYGIVAIPLGTDLGIHDVTFTDQDGTTQITSLTVTNKPYPEERITIADTTKVSPPPADLERIRRETAAMREVYALFSPHPPSPTSIILPVEGRISGVFGSRRFFNDQPRNPHSGLDVAAPKGTPIVSPISATVSLTGDFFFNGNTVMLDHGGGFISMMCHLDTIDVKQGDLVERGQRIGTVGSTGRSTGPHLHWSISLSGDRIDPQVFMDRVNSLFDGE